MLVALGSFFVLYGGVVLYASQALFDAESFTQRGLVALEDERVRAPLAEALVDELTRSAEPDLVNARPLLVTAIEAILDTEAFRGVFGEAVERAHQTLFTREGEQLVLNLADVTTVAIEGVRAVSPEIAQQIPADVNPKLDQLISSELLIDLVQLAEDVRFEGLVMPLIGLLLLGGAVVTDRDRRRGLRSASIGVAIALSVGLAVYLVGRSLALAQLGELSEAGAAVWDAYLGDLFTWLVLVLGLSLIVTAALTMRRRVDALEPLRRLGELAGRSPRSRWAQTARPVAVLVLGIAILYRPDAFVHVLAVAVGVYAVFYAASELLMMIAPPPATTEPGARVSVRERIRLVPAAGAAVLAMAVVVAVVALSGDEDHHGPRDPAAIERCNGFQELCDRHLSEVAFPSVHNAMSAAKDGFLMANNEAGISDQLEAGVRGLLIDAHWGRRAEEEKGLVVTDLEAEGGKAKARAEAVESTSEEFVTAAERLIQRRALGEVEGGSQGVYFCHVFCELGATPAVDVFRQVHDFLDRGPDEVVVLFIEDYVPPEEIERAVVESGLIELVYTPRRDRPLPTLREMIAADKRVLVMAEDEDGGESVPWYVDGFQYAQETPYTFESVDELEAEASCDPNRGGSDNPLFQLNHWIEKMPRSPKTAAEVNSYGVLLERARRCARERNLLPNLIGVDFWEHGDLFEVARKLNGLPRDAEPRFAGSD